MAPQYGFSKHFFQLMASKRNTFFDKPINKAVSGQKIDFDICDAICHEMKKLGTLGQKQVHVISLGTNNLRFKEEDLKPFFEQLAQQAKLIPNCHLVFCSLIPSNSTDKDDPEKKFIGSKKRFAPCSLLLSQMADGKNISFFNFNLTCQNQGELIQKYFFSANSGAKGYHLNDLGGKTLAMMLHRHLFQVVKPIIA